MHIYDAYLRSRLSANSKPDVYIYDASAYWSRPDAVQDSNTCSRGPLGSALNSCYTCASHSGDKNTSANYFKSMSRQVNWGRILTFTYYITVVHITFKCLKIRSGKLHMPWLHQLINHKSHAPYATTENYWVVRSMECSSSSNRRSRRVITSLPPSAH